MKILDALALSCGGSVTIHIEDISAIKDSDFVDLRNWLALMEHRYRRIAGVQQPEVERVKVKVLEEERDVPFKKVLARWMKDNELTGLMAAELTGVTPYTISKILNGKSEPRKATQDKILQVINTPGTRATRPELPPEQIKVRSHAEAVEFLVREVNAYMHDQGMGDNQFCDEVKVPINAIYNLKRHKDPRLPRMDQIVKIAEKLERVRPHMDTLISFSDKERADGAGHL